LPPLPTQLIRASAGKRHTHHADESYLARWSAGVEEAEAVLQDFSRARPPASISFNRVLQRLAMCCRTTLPSQDSLASRWGAERPGAGLYLRPSPHGAKPSTASQIGTLDSFLPGPLRNFSLELGLLRAGRLARNRDERRYHMRRWKESWHTGGRLGTLDSLLSRRTQSGRIDRELASGRMPLGLFRASSASTLEWPQCATQPVESGARTTALSNSALGDFSACGDQRVSGARDSDSAKLENEDGLRSFSGGFGPPNCSRKKQATKNRYRPDTLQPRNVIIIQHACSHDSHRSCGAKPEQPGTCCLMLPSGVLGAQAGAARWRFGDVPTQAWVKFANGKLF